MNAPIRRACVTLRNRQVHVRWAGSGPPVILVHQSPTSARTLDAQTAAYGANGFTAIAIDIPGLGRSDPLEMPQPEIADQAEALADFMDSIGVPRATLYGSHTGALICVELARRWPERIAAVLTDGYPIYTPDERARRVVTYFPSFSNSWDGAHLLWLWYRYREQYLFWPWNIPAAITRAHCDIPDPEFLHEGVIDLLRVGNSYRLVYAAAFRDRSEERIGELKVPVYFLAYEDDSLTRALRLLPSLPDCCHIEPLPLDREAGIAKEIDLIRRHPIGAAFSGPLATRPRVHGLTRRYVDVAHGQVAVRECGPINGVPLIVVPPAPGSATMLAPLIALLGRTRRVLAFDVPGCGDSDAPAQMSVAAMATMLGQAIEAERIETVDLYAVHGGCAIAAELAHRMPARFRRVLLEGIVAPPASAAPDYIDRFALPIEPRWDGTHLIALWHATRNRRLFAPWFEQTIAATRHGEPDVDPDVLTIEVLAYLESWRTYHSAWRAVLAHPTPARSRSLTLPVSLAIRSNDEFRAQTEHAARGMKLLALPDPLTERAEAIARFFAN